MSLFQYIASVVKQWGKVASDPSGYSLHLYLCLFLFLVFPPSSLHPQSNPINQTPVVAEEQDYAFALGLYRDGVYQMAEEQFGKFLERHPKSVKRGDALFLRSESRFYEGKYDSAIEGYTQYIHDYPQSKLVCDSWFRIGGSYSRLKKPTESIAAYKSVLDTYVDSDLAGESAYWIGEDYLQLGDQQNAIKYYTLAYENFPKNRLRDYAAYSIGWTYQKSEEYSRAADWYGRFLKEFPESSLAPSAKVRVGECYYYARDYQKAIDVLSNALPTIAPQDDRGQADYLIAEACYQLGRYPEAQRRYDAFLKEYPGHKLERDVVYALGWTYLKQSKYPEAIQTFDRDVTGNDALSFAALYRRSVAERLSGNRQKSIASLNDMVAKDPKGEFTDNASFDLGLMAYDSKDIPEAEKHFTRILTDFPRSDVLADSYMMLGECLLSKGDFKAARDDFAKAAADSTASFDTKLNSGYQVAWCLYKSGSLREASDKFADFIKTYPIHPKSQIARFWQAEAEYQLGNYQSALKGYQGTVASGTEQKREDAMYGVGWSYFKLLNYPKAVEAFEALVAAFPKGKFSFDAHLRIADAYFQMKDYSRAEGSYRVTMRLFADNPGADYAGYQLGQAMFRQQAYGEAYKQFESMIKAYPKSDLADDAQFALGWIDFQRKEYGDAIVEFRKLISAYPTSELVPRAQYSTGDAYYNLKKYEEAIGAYREVISRYPNSGYVADAFSGIQYCYSAEGKPKEAVAELDKFERENPGTTIGEDIELKKGDVLYGQGDYAGAEKVYRAFVAKFPKSKNVATARYWLAKSLRSQDRLADAASILEQSMASTTNSPKIASLSLYELAGIYSAQKKYDKAFEVLSRIERDFSDSEVYPDALYAK
ncbi:MAG TPA: tetratricopeptide repeat protein, partial [Bacteroidota bacterium]|nr:tetratricopeptide repeat protein [Bacteroidota bacterium]